MTNKLERLRELVRRAESSEHYWQQQASAMEFTAQGDRLLDRLEKLEAQIGKFQEESLYYMAQNAKMQAVVEAADESNEPLVVEIGKTYLDKRGESWTIVREEDGLFYVDNGNAYTREGLYIERIRHRDDGGDLIKKIK